MLRFIVAFFDILQIRMRVDGGRLVPKAKAFLENNTTHSIPREHVLNSPLPVMAGYPDVHLAEMLQPLPSYLAMSFLVAWIWRWVQVALIPCQ